MPGFSSTGVSVFRRSLLAALALAVAGCAAGGAVFQPLPEAPAGQGLVYIYWPAPGSGAVRIAVDGAPAGEVRAAGYLPLTLSAGPHVINTGGGFLAPNSTPLEVKVVAGASQYVRIIMTVHTYSNSVAFQSVSERAALSEITLLRLSE